MKAALVVVACLLGMAAAIHTEPEYQFLFRKFVAQHNKVYSMDEIFDRYNTFKANVEIIKAHNAKNLGWTMAVNEFADQTWEQFRAKHLGYKLIKNDYLRSKNIAPVSNVTIPTSVDWTAAGKVTPVKDQGQCGSCWAFSTTGSTEAAYAIAKGQLNSLSEQELVDCAGSFGNQGCNGGLMDYGFEYIISKHGLCSESAYPYKAVDGKCNTNCGTRYNAISSYKDVSASESALTTAIAQQPVSVAIEADQSGFQFYSSGVFSGACGTNLDHGVLATGYGTSGSTEYYEVKNSWGSSWGNKGYIWLVRGQNTNNGQGQCGIALSASYPIV